MQIYDDQNINLLGHVMISASWQGKTQLSILMAIVHRESVHKDTLVTKSAFSLHSGHCWKVDIVGNCLKYEQMVNQVWGHKKESQICLLFIFYIEH